jgi:glutathione peroxidase
VLVVNTASRCGFTDQLAGLEALHRERRADGLTVVGFPSDDFRQELDEDEEIADYCRLRYGVSFPLMARTAVTGRRAHPVFAAIAARPGPAGVEPSWNFTKYLLDRRGRLVARFEPSVEPDHPRLARAVEEVLAERAL